jgi:hypothetical protein
MQVADRENEATRQPEPSEPLDHLRSWKAAPAVTDAGGCDHHPLWQQVIVVKESRPCELGKRDDRR